MRTNFIDYYGPPLLSERPYCSSKIRFILFFSLLDTNFVILNTSLVCVPIVLKISGLITCCARFSFRFIFDQYPHPVLNYSTFSQI